MEIILAEGQTAELQKPEQLKALAAEQAKKERQKRLAINAMLSATSEFFFVAVPFVVIALALGHKGELKTFFFLPEWSIVSSVLMGQALMKLVSVTHGGEFINRRLSLHLRFYLYSALFQL